VVSITASGGGNRMYLCESSSMLVTPAQYFIALTAQWCVTLLQFFGICIDRPCDHQLLRDEDLEL